MFDLSVYYMYLQYCWLGLLTCKNRLPYNLYCVGGDVKHCSIQSCSCKCTMCCGYVQSVCYTVSLRLSLNLFAPHSSIPVTCFHAVADKQRTETN